MHTVFHMLLCSESVCQEQKLILICNPAFENQRLILQACRNSFAVNLSQKNRPHLSPKSLSCQTEHPECGSCELVRSEDQYCKDRLNDPARDNVFGAWVHTVSY